MAKTYNFNLSSLKNATTKDAEQQKKLAELTKSANSFNAKSTVRNNAKDPSKPETMNNKTITFMNDTGDMVTKRTATGQSAVPVLKPINLPGGMIRDDVTVKSKQNTIKPVIKPMPKKEQMLEPKIATKPLLNTSAAQSAMSRTSQAANRPIGTPTAAPIAKSVAGAGFQYGAASAFGGTKMGDGAIGRNLAAKQAENEDVFNKAKIGGQFAGTAAQYLVANQAVKAIPKLAGLSASKQILPTIGIDQLVDNVVQTPRVIAQGRDQGKSGAEIGIDILKQNATDLAINTGMALGGRAIGLLADMVKNKAKAGKALEEAVSEVAKENGLTPEEAVTLYKEISKPTEINPLLKQTPSNKFVPSFEEQTFKQYGMTPEQAMKDSKSLADDIELDAYYKQMESKSFRPDATYKPKEGTVPRTKQAETPKVEVVKPKKELWEMTLDEFNSNKLSELKSKYPKATDEMLMNQVNMNKQKWIDSILARAEIGTIPDKVLDDYIKQFGESDFYRTFRGVKEKAIAEFEPESVRVWNKTYREMLADKNNQLLKKGEVKKYHREAIEKALSQGKDVPNKVLKDYPDLIKQADKTVEAVKSTPVPEVKPKIKVANKPEVKNPKGVSKHTNIKPEVSIAKTEKTAQKATRSVTQAQTTAKPTSKPTVESPKPEVAVERKKPKIELNLNRKEPKPSPAAEKIIKEEIEAAQKERGFSRNVRNSEVTNDDLRMSLDEKPLNYTPITNKETLEKAYKLMEQDYEGALKTYELSKGIFKPEKVPFARMLANKAAEMGDMKTASRIIAETADELTQSGRFSQAGRILSDSDDPAAILDFFQRNINRINADGRKQMGKKWKDIELNEQELDMISKFKFDLQLFSKKDFELKAKQVKTKVKKTGELKSYFEVDGKQYKGNTVDEAYENYAKETKKNHNLEKEHKMEAVHTSIGSRLPVTAFEKLDSWRRISMLLNPKTALRNAAGNVLMMGMNKYKNVVAQNLEKLAVKTGKMSADETTKAFGWSKDKELLQIVKDNWDEVKNDLIIHGKYDVEMGVSKPGKDKNIFKTEFFKKLQDSTSWLLNNKYFGDEFFLGRAYKDSLGQYMSAKGLKQPTDEAIYHASQYALEATFRQANEFASMINRLKNNHKIGGKLLDAAIPFVKTPANIAVTAYNYSPAKLVEMLFHRNSDPAKVIDDLSKGLTGTSIVALGWGLASMGWAKGKYTTKAPEELMSESGEQPFSIITPIGSLTFDWAQPVAVPLAMGVSAYEAMQDKSIGTIEKVGQAIFAGGDALINQTMVMNIKEIFEGYGSTTEKVIYGLPRNYISQMFPTVLSQVARTFDSKERSNYSDSGVEKEVNRYLVSKVPGARQNLQPRLDIWGNETKKDTEWEFLGGAAQNLISPTTFKSSTNDSTTKELSRLYKSTKESIIVPTILSGKITKGGKDYVMTAQELTKYQKELGQLNYKEYQKLFKKSSYKNATDEEKVKQIKTVRDDNYDTIKAKFLKTKGVQ